MKGCGNTDKPQGDFTDTGLQSHHSRSRGIVNMKWDSLVRNLLRGLSTKSRKAKELSTKEHEEPRRATKGLEKAQEGSAKGREEEKDYHEGAEVSVEGVRD